MYASLPVSALEYSGWLSTTAQDAGVDMHATRNAANGSRIVLNVEEEDYPALSGGWPRRTMSIALGN